MKFHPYGIGRERQAVAYDTVKDHIVQYIQKTYRNGQDAAVSIRNLVVTDLTPHVLVRDKAIATDVAENLQQQAGMAIMYQAKLERYLDRNDMLEPNLARAYALIFSTYCKKTMQNRIEEHPDFETMICDDPIEFLNKIKVLMPTLQQWVSFVSLEGSVWTWMLANFERWSMALRSIIKLSYYACSGYFVLYAKSFNK
jgi:hypothetical protein